MGLSSTRRTVAFDGAFGGFDAELVGSGFERADTRGVAAGDGAAEPITSVCEAKRTSLATGAGCSAAAMRCSNVCQISGFGRKNEM